MFGSQSRESLRHWEKAITLDISIPVLPNHVIDLNPSPTECQTSEQDHRQFGNSAREEIITSLPQKSQREHERQERKIVGDEFFVVDGLQRPPRDDLLIENRQRQQRQRA